MKTLNARQLLAMVNAGENVSVDFKETIFSRKDGKPRSVQNQDIVRDLAAFANTGGGYLLIGVKDDGEIVGFESSDPIEQKLINICRDISAPPLRPHLQRVRVDGKSVLIIKIDKGIGDLCLVKGRVYIRVHNEVRMASSAEITDLVLRRNHERMRELLAEKDNLGTLIIKVSNLSAELFKLKTLINEASLQEYCQGKLDLKNVEGVDVEKLVRDGEKALTNLDSIDISNLASYIVTVNQYIEKLQHTNEVLEGLLDRYYCEFQGDW